MSKNYDENKSITNPLQIAYDEREDVLPPAPISREERTWLKEQAAKKADRDRRIASGELVIKW